MTVEEKVFDRESVMAMYGMVLRGVRKRDIGFEFDATVPQVNRAVGRLSPEDREAVERGMTPEPVLPDRRCRRPFSAVLSAEHKAALAETCLRMRIAGDSDETICNFWNIRQRRLVQLCKSINEARRDEIRRDMDRLARHQKSAKKRRPARNASS